MRSEAKKEQYMGSNIDTKSPPLIGRDQQIDDSFSYSESKSTRKARFNFVKPHNLGPFCFL